jgi:acyl carrier protein
MTTEQRVIDIISEDYPDDLIVPDMTLEELGVDELARAEITISVEDEFGIFISDDEMDSWKTVGDVVACVERLAAANQ